MKDYENYEDWNDQYEDDLGDQGQRLIKLLQNNAPQLVPGGEKYVEGGAVGKHILPLLGGGWLVADCYAYIGIGALDAYVHFGANWTGLLGIDPQRPKTAAWLKPGVSCEGFPSVIKEGLYDPDGSVYERTVYVHELIIGVGQPLRRLDQPICGTAFYKSTAYNIGKRFYHEQLKTTQAMIGGKRVRNMTACSLGEELGDRARAQPVCLDGAAIAQTRRRRRAQRALGRGDDLRQVVTGRLQAGPAVDVGAAAGDRRPAADRGAADPGLGARDAQARHPLGARRLEVGPAADSAE